MTTPQLFDPSALEWSAAALDWQPPAPDALRGLDRGFPDVRDQISPLPTGLSPTKQRTFRRKLPLLVFSRDSTLNEDETQARTDHLNQVATCCRQRIRELDDFARSEGFRVNPVSERAFWDFFKKHPFGAQPGLVLLDNGNLRAIWGDMKPTHVGLQFLPNDQIQYVVFARAPSAPGVNRGRGRVGAANILTLLEGYGLADVLDP